MAQADALLDRWMSQVNTGSPAWHNLAALRAALAAEAAR
jgi:hypothetical protein